MTETLSAYMLQNCATLTSSLYIYIRKTQQMYKSIYISMYIYSKQPNPNSKLYSLYIHEICEYIYTYIAIY